MDCSRDKLARADYFQRPTTPVALHVCTHLTAAFPLVVRTHTPLHIPVMEAPQQESHAQRAPVIFAVSIWGGLQEGSA